MFKNVFRVGLVSLLFFMVLAAFRQVGAAPESSSSSADSNYAVGVEDVIEVSVLRPEKLSNVVTVSPDGAISFPYIGSVFVKGMTLNQIQEAVQSRLADGYIKYPDVSVALKESRSRKFFISGE